MKFIILAFLLANIGLTSCQMSGFTEICSLQLQEISGQVESYAKLRDSLLMTGRFFLPNDFVRLQDGIKLLFSILDAIPSPRLSTVPIQSVQPQTPVSYNNYYDDNLRCCKALKEAHIFFHTCAQTSQINGKKIAECEVNLSNCVLEKSELIADQGLIMQQRINLVHGWEFVYTFNKTVYFGDRPLIFD